MQVGLITPEKPPAGDLEGARAARFTRRVHLAEEPSVVADLESMAVESGHSLAAEFRMAVRWWLRIHASEDS